MYFVHFHSQVLLDALHVPLQLHVIFFPSIIQSAACASCVYMAVGLSTEAWATRSRNPEGN